MSNKSRGRHRFAQEGAEREEAAAEQTSRFARLMEAFEGANTRAGLRNLVGLAMEERQESLRPPVSPQIDAAGPRVRAGTVVHEATHYQRAIASGLALLPQVYGGTVEPWVREGRRRRNKAARAARRVQRKAAHR